MVPGVQYSNSYGKHLGFNMPYDRTPSRTQKKTILLILSGRISIGNAQGNKEKFRCRINGRRRFGDFERILAIRK